MIKILYYCNWNISQLSYFYPILSKYKGALYCSNNLVETATFLKNSKKYNQYHIFNEIIECIRYSPDIIIYTQYPDFIKIPDAVHVMIDHGPDFKKEAYSYTYNDSIIQKYDLIACSGQYDIDSYALNNKKGNFIVCGCLKTEIIPERINIFPNDKKIILYAPSWHNNGCSISKLYDDIKKLSLGYYVFILPHCLLIKNEDDKNVLIKLIREQTENLRVIFRHKELETYFRQNIYSLYFDEIVDCCLPFIHAADFVITDMSSLIGEVLILNKPLYITSEKCKLTEKIIEERINVDKTIINIDLPHNSLRSYDKEYIFANIESTALIISESMKLFRG